MAFTLQQVIDKARDTLNDDAKDRYADAEALRYLTDFALTVRDKRPDLFIGNWSVDLSGLALGSSFSALFPDTFVPAAIDYIIFRAEFKEDEFVNNGRAEKSLEMFLGRI